MAHTIVNNGSWRFRPAEQLEVQVDGEEDLADIDPSAYPGSVAYTVAGDMWMKKNDGTWKPFGEAEQEGGA